MTRRRDEDRLLTRCPCGEWAYEGRCAADPSHTGAPRERRPQRERRKPCQRCGVPTLWKPDRQTPGICRDCRTADPLYVRAIQTGVRCA